MTGRRAHLGALDAELCGSLKEQVQLALALWYGLTLLIVVALDGQRRARKLRDRAEGLPVRHLRPQLNS